MGGGRTARQISDNRIGRHPGGRRNALQAGGGRDGGCARGQTVDNLGGANQGELLKVAARQRHEGEARDQRQEPKPNPPLSARCARYTPRAPLSRSLHKFPPFTNLYRKLHPFCPLYLSLGWLPGALLNSRSGGVVRITLVVGSFRREGGLRIGLWG